MALAPCSSEGAWDLLVDVSQHCNIKLRDVAAALVATTKDRMLSEPIQRELRRALRRLHAADLRRRRAHPADGSGSCELSSPVPSSRTAVGRLCE
ncbi:ANTAR domain-containing protein [Streptomyces sp. NBC_01092]|nr:ANTAR domain-containing protein [Streptomyces sp. NBC_01092]